MNHIDNSTVADCHEDSNRFSEKLLRKFWSRVNKDGPIQPHTPHLGKCWVWIGKVSPRGYGKCTQGAYGDQQAHRVSWRIANGEIPNGLYVLHRCDNTRCVNPAHLFTGNQSVNMLDMFSKNRATRAGESNPRARLNEADIRVIKRLLMDGIGTSEIARTFGVSVGTIGFIKVGKTWSNVS